MAKQPDYDYLLKLETWSKREAALILCGLEPQDYRGVHFTARDLPESLAAVYKLYRIFRTVDFQQKYQACRPHPLDYLQECQAKAIPVPSALSQAAARKIAYERQHSTMRVATLRNDVTRQAGARERNYLLKMLGALARVYFVEKNRNSTLTDSKVVVSDVVEDTLQFLESHDLHSPGLGKSNLHKKSPKVCIC